MLLDDRISQSEEKSALIGWNSEVHPPDVATPIWHNSSRNVIFGMNDNSRLSQAELLANVRSLPKTGAEPTLDSEDTFPVDVILVDSSSEAALSRTTSTLRRLLCAEQLGIIDQYHQ